MRKFLVAFDINGTLLNRIHRSNPRYKTLCSENVKYDYKYGQYFVYNRPYLDILAKFIESHDAEYVLWTTATSKNAIHMVKHLGCMGIGDGVTFYSKQDCKVGKEKVEDNINCDLWVKDLRIAARDYSVDVSDCVLVDDSVDKSVHDQNFICCSTFVAGEDDVEVIRICKHLDDFFKCPKDCIAKNLNPMAPRTCL